MLQFTDMYLSNCVISYNLALVFTFLNFLLRKHEKLEKQKYIIGFWKKYIQNISFIYGLCHLFYICFNTFSDDHVNINMAYCFSQSFIIRDIYMIALPAFNYRHACIRDNCVKYFVLTEWHLGEYLFNSFIRLLYCRKVIRIYLVFTTLIYVA